MWIDLRYLFNKCYAREIQDMNLRISRRTAILWKLYFTWLLQYLDFIKIHCSFTTMNMIFLKSRYSNREDHVNERTKQKKYIIDMCLNERHLCLMTLKSSQQTTSWLKHTELNVFFLFIFSRTMKLEWWIEILCYKKTMSTVMILDRKTTSYSAQTIELN